MKVKIINWHVSDTGIKVVALVNGESIFRELNLGPAPFDATNDWLMGKLAETIKLSDSVKSVTSLLIAAGDRWLDLPDEGGRMAGLA